MKRVVIVSEKVSLSNLLKSKLFRILPEPKIKLYKSLSQKITDYDVVFIDEKIARRGYRKEYKNILNLQLHNSDAKLIILGEESVWNRLKTKIDGADEYLSIESFTSELLEEYLQEIILN